MTIRFRFPCLLLWLLGSAAALGQFVPPASESVVVTATRSPEDEGELGSATTVITRERIEKSGATTVLELLRSVPGIDVLRLGGDGGQTSTLLRGTNSTHALVLVDGARVNSPYFPGYDFSAQTTENVERIEIVRGPFSALYGSDAIGGVIQILTRTATARATARVTLEAGDAGQRQGSVFFSAGTGPFAAAASYRDARGRRRPGELRLAGRRIAATGRVLRRLGDGRDEGAVLEGEFGLPGRRRRGDAQRPLRLPRRAAQVPCLTPVAGHAASFLAAYVVSRPTSSAWRSASTRRPHARTLQLYASTAGRRAATSAALVSLERWTVEDVTRRERRSTTTRTAGRRGAGRGRARTAGDGDGGLRYDRSSDFGDAWSPRANVAWRSADGRWKLRASGGAAFRAPTVGELFYPFSGNPELEPERSISWEVGAERLSRKVGKGGGLALLERSRELSSRLCHVEKRERREGRTRGVELAGGQEIFDRLDVDRVTPGSKPRTAVRATTCCGGPVIAPSSRSLHGRRAFFDLAARRVRRKAGIEADGVPSSAASSTVARTDRSLTRTTSAGFAPYAGWRNAADRRYSEVDGYPAPSRRGRRGLEVNLGERCRGSRSLHAHRRRVDTRSAPGSAFPRIRSASKRKGRSTSSHSHVGVAIAAGIEPTLRRRLRSPERPVPLGSDPAVTEDDKESRPGAADRAAARDALES